MRVFSLPVFFVFYGLITVFTVNFSVMAQDHRRMQPAPTPIEKEIAGLFDVWNKTLQTGTPQDMARLYAEDGVLLPTVSNDVRENRAEISDYFVHFLALKPRGTINEQHINVLDSNTAINAGIYTFDVIKDGVPQKVQARYTYVYEKQDGVWLIQNHHSSKMPEPILATTTQAHNP